MEASSETCRSGRPSNPQGGERNRRGARPWARLNPEPKARIASQMNASKSTRFVVEPGNR
jgi:hypothetical protein